MFAFALNCAANAENRAFSFAALGDTPYAWGERAILENMIATFSKQKLAFAVHIGDIKNGHDNCTDELFKDRFELLNASPVPLVFTPGDNDWTDCDRPSAGGYEPEERLARLREIFFTMDQSLGKRRMKIERQSRTPQTCCVENARWIHGGVVFATFHVVGSANNYGTQDPPRSEFVDRESANLAWIENTFALARTNDSPAIVIMLHANPGLEKVGRFRRHYKSFLELLRKEVERFDRPVLLIHGDTHTFRVDQPWNYDDPARGTMKLIRLETYGAPAVGWSRVRVDPALPEVFRIEPGAVATQ